MGCPRLGARQVVVCLGAAGPEGLRPPRRRRRNCRRTARSLMKIARFTEGGRTRLGIVATDADEIIDVGTADPSLPTDLGPLLSNGGLAAGPANACLATRFPPTALEL